jgi:hypothetical protein
MKCPECNADNPATAKFCGSCGSRIEAAEQGGGATTDKSTWDNVFKWIGIVVVGLFILGLLSGL